MKAILYRNQRFKALIEDEGKLHLHESVKMDAFMTLMNYYKGMSITIDESNISSLFTICFYYDEESLLNECIEYIIMKNINLELTITLLKFIYVISTYEKYSSLYQHIIKNCGCNYNEIMKDHILELDVVGIRFILKTKYLEINSENMIVNQLKYYYKENIKNLDDDFIETISEYINWNRVDENIKRDGIFKDYCDDQSRIYDRIYLLEAPEFSENNEFVDILHLYYDNYINFIDLEDDTFEKLEAIKKYSSLITLCLFSNNVKLTFTTFRCLTDAKYSLDNFLNHDQITCLVNFLLKEFYHNSNNFKDDVMRCLSLFQFDIILNGLTLLEYSYNEFRVFFFTLIYEPYVNPELYRNIYDYLSIYEECKEYLRCYEDHQLKYFNYERNEYRLHVNKNNEIIPKYNSCKDLCVFTISPELPEGVIINRRNGTISGCTKEISESTYMIICNSPSNKLSFQIKISFGVLSYFYYPENMYSFNLNEEILLEPIYDGDYCKFSCDKNVKLPDGLVFDKNTGIISGKVSDESECRNLSIICTDPKGKIITCSIDLYFGIITKFFYPTSQLSLRLCDEVFLEPMYDGHEVFFEVDGKLPDGLALDRESGCIQGNLLNYTGDEEYTIYAYNKSSTKSTTIRIISGLVKEFQYESHTFFLTNNSKLYIKPTINEGDFVFSVIPDLPSGITLNSETGEIAGEISADITDYHFDTAYTIRCRSIFNEAEEVIQMSFVNQFNYIPELGVKLCKNNYIILHYRKAVSLHLVCDLPDAIFSIYPPLPEGLMFLKNGDIVGETHNPYKKIKYTITCTTPNTVHYQNYYISIGELLMLYYDKKHYTVKNGEKVDIDCHFDGEDCEFSITPELPPSVFFNRISGSIYGTWDSKYSGRFVITCKNNTNTLHANIEIGYNDITYFSYKQYCFKFNRNEYFSIKPETDGENVKYSLETQLPESIKVDENSGIIEGYCDTCKMLNVIVECRNKFTYNKCEFTLEFI